MLVSSKHAKLASPVFKAMLEHSFREGEALKRNGRVEIPLPDDDPDNFLLLMKMAHAMHRGLPRVIPLDTLTKVTILVDKYRAHDFASFFAELWIDNMNGEIGAASVKDLVLWLAIAWSFRAAEFNVVTHSLVQNSTGVDLSMKHLQYEGIDLPIPEEILSK